MSSGKEFVERLPAEPSRDGFLDSLKYDAEGLLTVVVQDAESLEVLMVAYANREALRLTLEQGQMHYYSRSRRKLWLKGEESGHTQALVHLWADCDGDALVAQVRQVGGACHLGYRSCFAYEVQPNGAIRVAGPTLFDPHTVYRKT